MSIKWETQMSIKKGPWYYMIIAIIFQFFTKLADLYIGLHTVE